MPTQINIIIRSNSSTNKLITLLNKYLCLKYQTKISYMYHRQFIIYNLLNIMSTYLIVIVLILTMKIKVYS